MPVSTGCLLLCLPFFIFVQLIGIDKVVPDAVKTADHGSDGRKKGIAHPDGQHRILLSQGLPAGDSVPVKPAYLSAHIKLQNTAEQRNGHQPQFRGEGNLAVHNAAGRDGSRQHQCNSPKIKGKLLIMRQHKMQPGKKMPDQHCGNQRQKQQREDLAENQRRGSEQSHAGMGVYKRNQGRNQQSRGQIDQYGVSGDMGHIAPQFFGDDRSCCGRGANQAEHGPFKHHPHAVLGNQHENDGQHTEKSGLKQQQPEMPAAQTEFFGIYLAEREKQHGKDEQGLHDFYGFTNYGMCRLQKGYAYIKQISRYTRQYGDYKGPVFQESDNFHLISVWWTQK